MLTYLSVDEHAEVTPELVRRHLDVALMRECSGLEDIERTIKVFTVEAG